MFLKNILKKIYYNFLFNFIILQFFNSFADNKIITEHEIFEIYNNYIKPNITDENRSRYLVLPLEKNEAWWPWNGKDLPRIISLLEFERYVKNNNLTCNNGLAINGVDPEWHYIKPKELTHIDYLQDKNKFDLHTLNLPKKDFDFAICCQTLEHVYDPIRCLKNIYNHLAENGILYLLVPGDTIPHDTPIHFYTGFTAVGVGAMLKLAGFKILNIGHWGNIEYLKIMHGTNYWPDYKEFKHPIINDFNCSPITVWAFATK